jgi:hypothetical protein
LDVIDLLADQIVVAQLAGLAIRAGAGKDWLEPFVFDEG